MTNTRLQSEIIARGYAEIEHGLPNEWIQDAVSAYANFTVRHPDPLPSTMDALLPNDQNDSIREKLDDLQRQYDTQKQWHKYRTNVSGIGKPDGYTNRSFQVSALAMARGIHLPEEDPKEFYHFTAVHMNNMQQAHEDIVGAVFQTKCFC